MFAKPIAFASLLLGLGAAVHADFITPAWNRPTDNASAIAIKSTYQFFDVFGDDDFVAEGTQDLTPDLSINPNGLASVEETAGAFVTGTGNLYSPFVNLDMKLNVPGYAPTAGAATRFLLQIETLGSELVFDEAAQAYDFSRFQVDGTPIQSLRGFEYKELSRTPGMGATVRHAFAFVLPTTAQTHQITYQTRETSNSQSFISIDTFVAIPGDFDYDGDRDADDVDLLLRAVPGSSPVHLFDVNWDDQIINVADAAGSDLDAWVRGLEGTEYGDANLDGRVDFADLLTLAQNYGQPTGGWTNGDFDGSDTVGFDDLLQLAQHYGFGTGTLSVGDFDADWALARALVPEPASVAILMAATLSMRRRRALAL